MSNILTIAGDALTINFSVNNKLGVIRNQIPMSDSASVPVLADFADEVEKIFGGDLLNLSVDRLQATDEDKGALTCDHLLRNELKSVAGTWFDVASKADVETFYMSGIGPFNSDQVADIIVSYVASLCGKTALLDNVFVGAFKKTN